MKKKNMDSLRRKEELHRTPEIKQMKTQKLQNNERALLDILQSLDSKYENLIIVVEGKRDFSVLRNLGVKAPIIKTQSRLPRYRIVEKIVDKAGEKGIVLILTDYDQEGIEICRYLERELELSGVKTLQGVRGRIRKLMANWRCIEEFVSLLERSDSPEASHHQS
ncbi:hypothetical protein EU527_04950 [Candidatus Thorarchaeota archaeon]|nr:MAG: hypothetical protein EU527_04950 [Candidatus Thorarchaeota archaeon]